MHHFYREVILDAAPDDVFAFHENPHNIQKISPWFLQIIEIQADTKAIAQKKFILKLRIFGFPLRWNGLWETVDPPNLLVDTASLFPFRIWRHEHRFEGVHNGTRMIDDVTYTLPYGWLGRLFGETIFRLQLILMFAGRHRATKAWFERQAKSS